MDGPAAAAAAAGQAAEAAATCPSSCARHAPRFVLLAFNVQAGGLVLLLFWFWKSNRSVLVLLRLCGCGEVDGQVISGHRAALPG